MRGKVGEVTLEGEFEEMKLCGEFAAEVETLGTGVEEETRLRCGFGARTVFTGSVGSNFLTSCVASSVTSALCARCRRS